MIRGTAGRILAGDCRRRAISFASSINRPQYYSNVYTIGRSRKMYFLRDFPGKFTFDFLEAGFLEPDVGIHAL